MSLKKESSLVPDDELREWYEDRLQELEDLRDRSAALVGVVRALRVNAADMDETVDQDTGNTRRDWVEVDAALESFKDAQ